MVDYIEIPGRRYQCKVRYAKDQKLDRLAAFVHRMLVIEPRIDVLIESLMLPERLVEDILADLIQGNYAVLDVRGGKVHPVRQSEDSHRRYQLDPRPLHVWVDDTTGVYLPARLVDDESVSTDATALRLPTSGDADRFDFRYVPDARVIAGLLAVSPSALGVLDPESSVDGFEDKTLLGRQFLKLPVRRTAMGSDGAIEYVGSPRFPHWLCRMWTELYRTMTSATGNSDANRLASGGLLDECDLVGHFESWAASVKHMASMDGGAITNEGFDEEAELRSALVQRVDDAMCSRVHFFSPGQCGHLVEMLRAARRYLLIVLPDTGDSFHVELGAILSATEGLVTPQACLILACGFPATDAVIAEYRKRLALRNGIVHVVGIGRNAGPALAIRDGEEVVFGNVSALLASSPALHIESRDLEFSVAAQLPDDPLGNMLGRIVGGATARSHRQRRTNSIFDCFQQVSADITRIRTERLLSPDSSEYDKDETTGDGSIETSLARSGEDALRALVNTCVKVQSEIDEAFRRGLDVVVRIPFNDGIAALLDVLEQASVNHAAPSILVHVPASRLEEFLGESWKCFRRVFPAGPRIEITSDCRHEEDLRTFAERIEAHGGCVIRKGKLTGVPELILIECRYLLLGPFTDDYHSCPILADSVKFGEQINAAIQWV